MLSFTPPEWLSDARGRPYFLWDCDLAIEEFRARLEDSDSEVRADPSSLIIKRMRQAKPDDVFLSVRPHEIRELWRRLLLGDPTQAPEMPPGTTPTRDPLHR